MTATMSPATDAPSRDRIGAPAEAAAPATRLRLLHIFPSFGIGGIEIRIATMINRLGDRYAHDIVAMDGVYDAAVRLAPHPGAGRPFARPFAKTNPFVGAIVARRHLRALRPDLLLTHNWGAIEWALANRFLPLCRHVHFESGFGSVAEATYRRRVLLRRLALGRAERIVVPSAALYDLATRTWGIDAARVVFVPNGVDLALFGAEHPTEIHPTLAGIAADVIVGTVTSLRPEKNLGRLIRAFAVATAGRRAHLVIAGSGPEQPTLEAAAHAAGVADRVRFAGYVDDPHRLIPGFDIYAMSSNTEQMPNALIQAMAARRAIASTDVGDIKRIVAEPNRAFVVAPEDEAALAGALARLMDDADLRARLGEANRDRAVARYDIERMTAAYRAVFDGTPLPPGNERPDAP